ncbi:hypothetical protein C8R47DRAFT_1082234 [Mycena vitilis]|nr:hypothetical protein C8R47DRAFT_1082234 [Mycena vitilis]
MDNFNEIYAQLNSVPGLCDSLGMEKAMEFIRIGARLKDTKDSILVAQPPHHDAAEAPESIPDHIREFMGSSIDLPPEFIDGCWTAFGSLIWTYDEDGKSQGSDAQAFRKYGLDHLLGTYPVVDRVATNEQYSSRCYFHGSTYPPLHDAWVHQYRITQRQGRIV